jgi:hypothetical protein
MNRLKRLKGFTQLDLLIYGGAFLAFAGAIAGSLWYAYHLGSESATAKLEAQYATERLQRQDLISSLAVELGERATKRHEERQQILFELDRIDASWKGVVNRYVPPNPARSCPVTVGWVQYHDERAAGLPAGAGPTPGTAGADSGVKEAEALETVGDNYSAYYKCKERVRQVIQTYDDVQQTTNGAVKRMNDRLKRIERKLQ